jgi:hypothetical protein
MGIKLKRPILKLKIIKKVSICSVEKDRGEKDAKIQNPINAKIKLDKGPAKTTIIISNLG